ncbi:jg15137 [Pararge aegeria aegeria]|uniref:Jg15137 protein n=1 Tax=Pararge aegeria aegeria TaxID=348720 RepID=A0A8S4RXU7_9NEOP|nr:jg15137 [Pararge aegeria aegeria]
MKSAVYFLALLAAACAAPAAQPEPAAQPSPADDNTPEIIEIIAPAGSAQETLSTLNLGAPGSELSERNKRTIGILRQLFPTLTQIIEQKVQEITSQVLKVFGPIFLRVFLGNNNNGGRSNSGTVELDDDDDDDDDDDEDEVSSSSSTTMEPPERRKRALFFLPRSPVQREGADHCTLDYAVGSLTVILQNAVADENQLLSGAESQQAEVRVAFGDAQAPSDNQAASDDQETAAQTNNAAIDEITLDDADDSEENRNKRFLGGSTSSSGGGSGNFLFDVVRRPAEMVARAAGNAFRLFAGTDQLSVGLRAAHSATLDPALLPQLIAGSSSGSSSGDAAAAEGEDAGGPKGDNLTEGVPGPITRLFIIANRGIANLIQDLILRIAQTSERIVNFKARLITSII